MTGARAGRQAASRPRLPGSTGRTSAMSTYAYYRIGNHHDAEDITGADLRPGVPPLRPRPARVERATAAAMAHPDRAQPRGELLPRPLTPAAGRTSTTPRSFAPLDTEEVVEEREEVKEVLEGVSKLPDDRARL